MNDAKRIAFLEELVARLEAENADLKKALIGETVMPLEFGLTQSESRVLAALVHRPMCTKVQLMAALYLGRIDDEPEIKIIDVFVCKMRRKLKPFDIDIKTHWGQGYYLEEEVRRALKTTSTLQDAGEAKAA